MTELVIANIRRDESAATRFAAEPLFRFYARSEAAPEAGRELNDSGFGDVVTGRRVLLAVHGFTTSAVGAVADFQKLRKNLELNAPSLFDVIVGLSWPAGAELEHWARAQRWADHAAIHFSDLGRHYLASAKRRDVFTHSLGARVCFEALDREALHPGSPPRWLHTLWCTTPAIGDESIDLDEVYGDAFGRLSKAWVFFSKHDQAIHLYELEEHRHALGYLGPYWKNDLCSPKLRAFDCKSVIGWDDHGAYYVDPAITSAMRDAQRKPAQYRTRMNYVVPRGGRRIRWE